MNGGDQGLLIDGSFVLTADAKVTLPIAPTDAALLAGELRIGGRLDARFFALLQAIDATGSISRAARTAGYSYKGAWMVLENAGNLTRAPLIASATGGKGGGGTHLTPLAFELLHAWQHLTTAHRAFLREYDAWLTAQPALAGALRRLSMKTTARNQFAGTVTHVEAGPVTTQVTLSLAGGQAITAALTSGAAKKLKLKKGQEAIALVKASAIVLVTDFAGYALSARNQLAGNISRVDRGAVSSLVGVTLPGGTVVTASVTHDAVEALDLAVGQPATAVFKAFAVMLAVAVG